MRGKIKTIFHHKFDFHQSSVPLETRRIEREKKIREHQQRKLEKEASRTSSNKRDSLS